MLWLEPPKGFSVKKHMEKVIALARKFRAYDGKTMSDALFEDLLHVVVERMRYPDPVGLRPRMRGLLLNGEVIDEKTLMRLAMFLMEHNHELKAGKLLPEWNGSPHAWFVSRIISVVRGDEPKKGMRLRYVVRLVAMNGPLAGNILRAEVSTRYAAYMPKMLGAPKRTEYKVMPYDSIGMVAYTKFGTTGLKSFTLMEFQATSSMKTRNKDLFERRKRPR